MSKLSASLKRAKFVTSSGDRETVLASVASSGKPSRTTIPKVDTSSHQTSTEPQPRVLNKYRDFIPPGAVNIMRPGKWGNPFHDNASGRFRTYDREEAVKKHKRWLLKERPDLVADAKKELRGKDLVCCHPGPCHGHILVEVANA